ncbi:MAG: hypothetical protein RBU29_16940 [bacterium]|nr:hypothetical protein [bacterium]
MKKIGLALCLVSAVLVPGLGWAQPAASPEEAGIVAITGDVAPWRSFGYDVVNFDNVWILGLNNGSFVAFKRGMTMDKAGELGGTEFLLFGPDGALITSQPIRGSFNKDGKPTPYVDYAGTGLSWGGFTLGAAADRARGTGFVVHNLGENAETFGLDYADEVGDDAYSMVQLFDNAGNPQGHHYNAFGALTGEPGDYRDIGAILLSNGDLVALGENRQQFDPLLESVGASATEVVMAVILGPDGTVRKAPFVVHTGEDGQYLGGSTGAVFQNMTAFEGGFVIDYSAGIRWYGNDGTPLTPVQPDHAELAGLEMFPDFFGYTLSANTGGRGDNMALASNGKDLVVKSAKIEAGQEAAGILIYYNTDGTVKHWVRFDDVDLDAEPPQVDRTFCDMDTRGNVFVVWEDKRFGGLQDDGYSQIFGRFFNAAGEPYGPSFPVFQNWQAEPSTVDYGGGIGAVPRGDQTQPRCAINDQGAAVISASTLMPDLPDAVKQLSNAFGLVLTDVVVRFFENPYAESALHNWPIY